MSIPMKLPASQAPLIVPSLRPYLTEGSATPKKHPKKAPRKRKLATPKGNAPKKRGRR
jgi:hypothetical protein